MDYSANQILAWELAERIKIKIVLQSTVNSGDYGENVSIQNPLFICEGFNDGDKEYVKGDDEQVFERYTCYSVISPYGWKKSDKKWEDVCCVETP